MFTSNLDCFYWKFSFKFMDLCFHWVVLLGVWFCEFLCILDIIICQLCNWLRLAPILPPLYLLYETDVEVFILLYETDLEVFSQVTIICDADMTWWYLGCTNKGCLNSVCEKNPLANNWGLEVCSYTQEVTCLSGVDGSSAYVLLSLVNI